MQETKRFLIVGGAVALSALVAEYTIRQVAPARAQPTPHPVETTASLYFLPGNGDDPKNSWVEERTPTLIEHGVKPNKIDIKSDYNPQGHDLCLERLHNAIETAPEDELDIAGYSAGAGVLEMYLDALGQGKLGLSKPNKIRRAIFLNGRNLYRLDLTACPPNLVGLYRQLQNPSLAWRNVREIRVAYGGLDKPWLSDNGLAQAYGVEPLIFAQADHGDIVGNDENLLKAVN